MLQLIQKQFGNKYTNLNQCGSGAYSTVYRCQNENGKFVAIKVIDTEKAANIIDTLKYESTLLQKCDNENVIKLYESSKLDKAQYLVLEYCEMDLKKMVTNYYDNKVPENIVIVIFKQLINGLYYLHKNNIIHRDLKLENIGVVIRKEDLNNLENNKQSAYDSIFKNATYKLIDFGFSKQLLEETKSFTGSLFNMAPEVLKGDKYSFPADIYSLGVCLYQMITGQYPYQGSKVKEQFLKIKNQKAKFDTIKDQLLRNTIQEMLQFDVTKRLTFKELYQSELFRFENSIMQNSEFYFINTTNDDLEQSLMNETQLFSIIQYPNQVEIETSKNESIVEIIYLPEIDNWKKQKNICTCISNIRKRLHNIIETPSEIIQLYQLQNVLIEYFKYYSKLVEKLFNKLKKEVNEKSDYFNIQLYTSFRDSLENFEFLNIEYAELNPTYEHTIQQIDDIDNYQNLQSIMQINNEKIFTSINRMLEFIQFNMDKKFQCNCYLLQYYIIILYAENQDTTTEPGDDQYAVLKSEDFGNNPDSIFNFLQQLMLEKEITFEGQLEFKQILI